MKDFQICPLTMDNASHCARHSFRQHGLTLIELMISITLGLFLVGGVLSIFVSTNQTAKLNDNLMRVQENARGAFDLMARDIREAGQNPCGARKNIANVLRASGTIPVWTDWNLGTLRGYDNTADETGIKAFGTAAAARVSGTDAVLAIKADADEKAMESHDPDTTMFTLTSGSSFQENDIAFVCDALSSAIFQIYDISPKSGASTATNLDHQADSTNMNCGDFLSFASPATTCPATVKKFEVKSDTPEVRIAPLASSFWYIGNSNSDGNGKRSLYRSKITRSGTKANPIIIMKADEIIPDVQDLQITYLTRDGTTGTLASNWVAASTITDWADDNATAQVVAAKLDLTLQTVDKVSTSQAVIQRHLIHVVGLRNRDVYIQP